MLQRLQIKLAQIKSDNASEKLPNKICQIIYSFLEKKEVTKKIYTVFNKDLEQNGRYIYEFRKH